VVFAVVNVCDGYERECVFMWMCVCVSVCKLFMFHLLNECSVHFCVGDLGNDTARERKSVCERERERSRDRDWMSVDVWAYVYVRLCVNVCEWVWEREERENRGRGRGERERERGINVRMTNVGRAIDLLFQVKIASILWPNECQCRILARTIVKWFHFVQ
jgi:hypothetical protein